MGVLLPLAPLIQGHERWCQAGMCLVPQQGEPLFSHFSWQTVPGNPVVVYLQVLLYICTDYCTGSARQYLVMLVVTALSRSGPYSTAASHGARRISCRDHGTFQQNPGFRQRAGCCYCGHKPRKDIPSHGVSSHTVTGYHSHTHPPCCCCC